MVLKSASLAIEVSDGSMQSYRVSPDVGAAAGVVVIQEIFGVNSHIREVADKVALAGYGVLAPDIFHRQQPGVELGYEEADIGTGFALMQQLDIASAVQDIGACVAALREETGGHVAVMGFCMGGLLAYLSAAAGQPDAAVAYYGGGIADHLDQVGQIQCPLLFHFGEQDDHIPMAQVEAIRGAVSGIDATIHTYPAGHGFNCDQRGSYDAAAANLAWQRTEEFLARHLL